MTLRSKTPGMAAQAFIRINRRVRPMVALARLPGPNKLLRELIFNSLTTGPLTMDRMAEPPMLEEGPTKLNTGSSIASVAAKTTGMYSGRHPAITALAATLPTVISRRRSGNSPMTSLEERPDLSMNSSTRLWVGGTTGRPSVQPNS